jgi:hypothetical protein
MKIMDKNDIVGYKCDPELERPEVFCAFGGSVAQAFINMGRMLDLHDITYVTAVHVDQQTDDLTILTAYAY